MIQALICLTLLIVSALSVLSPNVLPTPRWCPTSRVGPAAVGAGWCSLPCNWEFAHRTDILFGLPLTCPSMWSVVLVHHPDGARTVQCAVCTVQPHLFTYFWNRYSKPDKWRKNQVHENCGVRVGTCGSLSQTQPKTPSRVPNCYFPNPLKKFMMKSTSVQIHFIENAVYKLMKELECFKCWLESSFNANKWLAYTGYRVYMVQVRRQFWIFLHGLSELILSSWKNNYIERSFIRRLWIS